MVPIKPIVIEQAPANIEVRFDRQPVELPADIRSKHNDYWEQQIKDNPSLRNGEVFTIIDIASTGEGLVLTVAKTDYKHYLYTLRHENSESPCKVIYTCAAVITNDNYIAIGRMNGKTSTPGRLQFTGGGLEESDLKGNIFDLEKNIKREVKEEMGIDIDASTTSSFLPKFLKHKGSHDFWAVIYEIAVNYTASELHDLFNNYNNGLLERGQQPEFDELLLLPLEKTAIEKFIQNEQSPMVDYLIPVLGKYIDMKSY